MSEDADKMVVKAQAQLHEVEQKAVNLKRFINQVLEFDGQPPLYNEEAIAPKVSSGSIRSDQFYGRPLATVVREVLEMRKAANAGAATVNEIYAKLTEGGFGFDGTANEENAKRVLRISLAKNPAFHKLPNGQFGLSEWYPAAKVRKAKADGASENGSGSAVEDADAAPPAAAVHDVDVDEI